jgi:hypothetical protein
MYVNETIVFERFGIGWQEKNCALNDLYSVPRGKHACMVHSSHSEAKSMGTQALAGAPLKS